MNIHIEFTGRLTAEPHLYANDDGTTKRLLFNVAVNTKGEDFEHVDFVPCIMWGDDRIPKLQPWMLKGRMVHIRGYLRTRDIRDDDGKFKRKDFEIVVQPFEFLDKKPDIEVPEPAKKEPAPAATAAAANANMLQMMQQMVNQMAALQANPAQAAEQAAEPTETQAAETASNDDGAF